MLEKILFAVAMLVITLVLQFVLFRMGKGVSFWSGTEPVYIMCILGLVSNDASYFAGILGYAAGDYIGKLAGWHEEKTN